MHLGLVYLYGNVLFVVGCCFKLCFCNSAASIICPLHCRSVDYFINTIQTGKPLYSSLDLGKYDWWREMARVKRSLALLIIPLAWPDCLIIIPVHTHFTLSLALRPFPFPLPVNLFLLELAREFHFGGKWQYDQSTNR